MRALLQRVSYASVKVDDKVAGMIGNGLLIFAGVEDADTVEDIQWLASKILNMRIFRDDQDKMNLSVKDIQGDLLVISQFTLFANTRKGNRPSFMRSGSPEKANEYYELLKQALSLELGRPVQSGIFAADMKVELLNDGPVTIFIDSKNRE